MAETALYLALRKIGRALAPRQEDSSDQIGLPIFQSRLRRIESELRMIHCFLDQLETRYSSNQALVSWIAEAQRLGCLVEETVDVQIHRLFHPSRNFGTSQLGICAPVWILGGIFLSLESRRQAFIQLIELEEELQHLSKLKKLWVQMDNNPERSYISSISETANLPTKQLVSGFNNEEPVGFEMEMPKLTARLEHKDGASKVVAVLGRAGSGKTTLVRSVYEQQRRHFECCAWISMSGCYTSKDVLTKMVRELSLEGEIPVTNQKVSAEALTLTPDLKHLEHLIKELKRGDVLKTKRFLIVFDDTKVIEGIYQVCDLMQSQSRLIITTRNKEVATEFDKHSIDLAGLQDAEAQELFRRVVLRNGTEAPNKDINDIYKDVMGAFPESKKLPQVVISLGASLSVNHSIRSASQHIKKQLVWMSTHNSSLDDQHKCLYVAYINIPMHLKVCLLYCGIFPAGYPLLREKLVRLWVAEGFIKKQSATQVEEEIAEEYLMVLTSWGFLQCVPGSVGARLQMPIVVHELVRSLCRKEVFGIASEDFDVAQEDTNVRCLFTSKYPKDIRSLMHLPHLRTLIVSESASVTSSHFHTGSALCLTSSPSHHIDCICVPVLFMVLAHVFIAENIKTMAGRLLGSSPQRRRRLSSYLTVLELQGSPDIPHDIEKLFNLQYLGLGKTKMNSLPRSMRSLYNLQTLDLESSNITELPHWIGELTRLRHLLAGKKYQTGVTVRNSVMKLKELQTLETVEASVDFVNNVESLTQIRSMCISNVESRHWEILNYKLSLLPCLSSLAVGAKNGTGVLELSGLCANKQLKSLELRSCRLGENALDLLAKNLCNLESLILDHVSGITKLEFQLNCFTMLRALILRHVHDVVTLFIRNGALAGLKVLQVESLSNLEVEKVEDLTTIKSVNDLFFPQLLRRNHLARNDEAESSSRASGEK